MQRWKLILFIILMCCVGPAHAASVLLGWTASSPTTGVTGYRIYYGTATGVYTANQDAGLSTTGTVGGLVAGTTYYFVVRAYNATADESTSSNEVSQLIPTVPTPPTVSTPLALVSPVVR